MRHKTILIIIVSVILGWFAHYLYLHIQDSKKGVVFVRENSSQYKFINPLLYITNNSVESKDYDELKNEVDDYISKSIGAGEAKNISFYFNDLNAGTWVGVNENDLFAPSSMLKVSLLVVFVKMADGDPSVLSEQAYYQPGDDAGQNYKPTKKLPAGFYSVQTLLEQMITYSDNDAMATLQKLHEGKVLDIYKDLRLPDPGQEALDFMSPREYSRIYRSLYNGAYISHFNSEQALKLLSKTNFKEGIVSGLGSTTIVSHKFGELTSLQNGSVEARELHDCGIVYYPGKPYFICIMTRGQDFPALSKIISDISKLTFDYMGKEE